MIASMSTVRNPITCPECGFSWTTKRHGRSVECRMCQTSIYIPRDPGRNVPLADRARRQVHCGGCGWSWATRVQPGAAVPCPQCRKGVWVRADAPAVAPPPGRDRPAKRSAPRTVPARTRTRTEVYPQVTASPLLAGGTLQTIIAGLFRTGSAPGVHHPVRKPAPPGAPIRTPIAPARTASAPPPVPGYGSGADHRTPGAPVRTVIAPAPVPPGSPWEIGPDTARALALTTPPRLRTAGLGLRLVDPADRHPGTCAMLDTRLGTPCRGVATQRAIWSARAFMPVCSGHAVAVTRCAEECEGITVRIASAR